MKCKLLVSALVVFVGLASGFAVFGQKAGSQFRGTVGEAKVVMDLTRDGGDLTGSYYYRKSGGANRLALKGTISGDGDFTLQEMDAAGKQTGSFKGKWKQESNASGASLEGEWLKPGQKDEGLGFYAFEQMIYFTSAKITSREFKESIKAKKATLTAEYPELSGNANAAGFNLMAKNRAMGSLAAFRKDLAGMTVADIRQMGEMGNYIEVFYNVEYADDDLISISFVESTFTGGAHPNHNYVVLTYDLKAGRGLKLADLFKPGAKYLTTIADYAISDLKGRKDPESGDNMGIAQDIWEDGAKPTADNYRNWNITKKGLMITFPPYQVAAYAYGPQTVIIPFAKLKSIARPDGAFSKSDK